MSEKIRTCKDCFYCKVSNNITKCSLGYFKNIPLEKIELFMPDDFDCLEWDGEY